MKKIKNKTQLQEKSMQLRIRELELEKTLRKDWTEIKELLNPETLLRKKMAEREDGHWLLHSLGIATSLLSKEILGKAESEMEQRIEKKVNKWNGRLKAFFRRPR